MSKTFMKKIPWQDPYRQLIDGVGFIYLDREQIPKEFAQVFIFTALELTQE